MVVYLLTDWCTSPLTMDKMRKPSNGGKVNTFSVWRMASMKKNSTSKKEYRFLVRTGWKKRLKWQKSKTAFTSFSDGYIENTAMFAWHDQAIRCRRNLHILKEASVFSTVSHKNIQSFQKKMSIYSFWRQTFLLITSLNLLPEKNKFKFLE